MKTRKGNKISTKLDNSVSDNPTNEISLESIVIRTELKELIRPRTDAEQANLTEDIKNNGLSTPITLTTFDGQTNCLVDGHGRLQAYQQLANTSIPYQVKEFKNLDAITAWVYRKQLGRRNLTKQDRAYLIGSLPDSKKSLAEQFLLGTRQVATYRKYFKAVNWLVKNTNISKEKLLDKTITSVISQFDGAESASLEAIKKTDKDATGSKLNKKAVNWKLSEDLVDQLKKVAKDNGISSVSQQVENIIQEYLDNQK